jgi:hypothetical protein
MKNRKPKNTIQFKADFGYLTEDVKDIYGCRAAIKSHLIHSFGYTEAEAVDSIAYNLARLNLN